MRPILDACCYFWWSWHNRMLLCRGLGHVASILFWLLLGHPYGLHVIVIQCCLCTSLHIPPQQFGVCWLWYQWPLHALHSPPYSAHWGWRAVLHNTVSSQGIFDAFARLLLRLLMHITHPCWHTNSTSPTDLWSKYPFASSTDSCVQLHCVMTMS